MAEPQQQINDFLLGPKESRTLLAFRSSQTPFRHACFCSMDGLSLGPATEYVGTCPQAPGSVVGNIRRSLGSIALRSSCTSIGRISQFSRLLGRMQWLCRVRGKWLLLTSSPDAMVGGMAGPGPGQDRYRTDSGVENDALSNDAYGCCAPAAFRCLRARRRGICGNEGQGGQGTEEEYGLCVCLPEGQVVFVHDGGQDGRSVRLRDRGRAAVEGSPGRQRLGQGESRRPGPVVVLALATAVARQGFTKNGL